jgi:putative nucleotidyltransferase with HDIG domain
MSPITPTRPKSARQLDDILNGVNRLRPLPTSTTRILNALDNPRTTAGIISDLISLDQALTAYILRVANAAYLGYNTSCSSINDAVMRLGFKQIRSLVLSTISAGPLSSRLNGYRLGDKDLWQHSITTACAAHWLAGSLRYNDPEEAYAAGLLHDIGKLVLDQFVLADYSMIVDTMRKNNKPMYQIEEELFGVDHAAVGGLIAKRWEFPNALMDAIHYHHSPSLAPTHRGLAAIINLANALTPQEAIDQVDLYGRTVHPETLIILKIDQQAIDRLKSRLTESLFKYSARQAYM